MSQQAAHNGVKIEEYAMSILKRQLSQPDGKGSASNFLKVVRDLRSKKSLISKSEAKKLDQELRQTVARRKPHFQTVEQAMSWSRGYSWGPDDPD